jgi:tetratricopeptide (TPR) repeat protein
MIGVVAFFITDRYRLPVVPFLLPFAAYGLVSLFRPGGLKRMFLALGLILAFGLAMSLGLPAGPRLQPAESHATLGEAFLRKELTSPAEEQFQQALSLAPSYVRAMIGLARVYGQTDRNDQAVALWRRALALRPQMGELHFQMGFPLYAAGRLDEAIAAWQEAARLEPQLAQPHFQLAIAYEDRGEYQQAIEEYQRALQANPGYVLADYNLAHLYVKMGRIREAVIEFKKAIEINPRFGDAYNSLAWLYAQEGTNLDEGIELANKALELDLESGAYWDTLAELHIKKGEVDRAREIFHRMIQREPHNSFWKDRLQQLTE